MEVFGCRVQPDTQAHDCSRSRKPLREASASWETASTEASAAELRVHNTFLEYHLEQPVIRRADTAPAATDDFESGESVCTGQGSRSPSPSIVVISSQACRDIHGSRQPVMQRCLSGDTVCDKASTSQASTTTSSSPQSWTRDTLDANSPGYESHHSSSGGSCLTEAASAAPRFSGESTRWSDLVEDSDCEWCCPFDTRDVSPSPSAREVLTTTNVSNNSKLFVPTSKRRSQNRAPPRKGRDCGRSGSWTSEAVSPKTRTPGTFYVSESPSHCQPSQHRNEKADTTSSRSQQRERRGAWAPRVTPSAGGAITRNSNSTFSSGQTSCQSEVFESVPRLPGSQKVGGCSDAGTRTTDTKDKGARLVVPSQAKGRAVKTDKAPVSTGSGRQRGSAKRGGPSSVIAAARKSPEDVWVLACRSRGSSLSVQEAVHAAATSLNQATTEAAHSAALWELQLLLQAFHGREVEAATHPSANYALQVLLELAPPHLTEFIPTALLGRGVRTSMNRIGCRVVLRVFRHQLRAGSWAAAQLADEIAPSAAALSSHEFANYVIQELLEKGSPAHKNEITMSLSVGGSEALLRSAVSSHASCVLQKALKNCGADVKDAMITPLISDKFMVRTLLADKFGRHVAKAICGALRPCDSRRAWLEAMMIHNKQKVCS
uniref:PUM-HD domain-containing protein n=1 Tax=Noctiluca scintillans TaxID=2966 RepID=A0A7S1B179_NOCSC|mmetsp:Transcript_7785/g.21328  ORF Transcript_7785/g.21328 Transcript_7785/m.21328 type:complete len:660 (+) Transcript_7785:50-2029(+)